MAFKPITIIYNSKNFITGLTDVVGEVYVDQVAKAVAGSAIAFTELDATNAPGTYYAVISAANQVTWSAVAGSIVSVYCNSTSKPAPAEFKQIVTAVSTDDLSTSVAAVQTTVNTISTNVSAIESDVTDATTGLPAIKTAINSLSSQVSGLQNNTNFECFIPENGFVLPATGSTIYRIPINTCNASGSVDDPDSNSIIVSCANVAGTDEGAILTGYSGGSAPAVRDAAGQYHIDLTLPSSFTPQELIFSFAYTMSSSPYNKQRSAIVLANIVASGYALQTTLLATQVTVNDIDSQVNNGTYGLAALEALLTNGTFGLSAIETTATANNTLLTNGVYGLAALNTTLTAIEGSGFTGSTDSLHAISAYMTTNLYAGGKVI